MEIDETNPLAGSAEPTPETSETPVIENETPIEDDGPIDLDAPEETSPEPAEETPEPEVAPEPDPLADVEYEGKVFKVPAELKDALLRQADYTRKTQEVAKMRDEIKARETRLEEFSRVSEDEMKVTAYLMNVDEQLKGYEGVDWNAVEAQDPLLAQSEWRKFQQLKEQRQNADQFKTQLVQQRSQFAEQETANRLKATAEFAQREIKGWSPDLDAKITEFAVKELGFTVDTLKAAYNPQVYKTLHLAHIGQQTLNRQSAAKPAAPAIAPTQTVSAKSSPAVQKDPADMSMAEYVAFRAAQEKRRK